MESLFDDLAAPREKATRTSILLPNVEQFTQADTSRNRIVSRTIDRLHQNGFIVVGVEETVDRTSTTSAKFWRIGERRRTWRIEFVHRPQDKVKHKGSLDLTQVTQTVEAIGKYNGPMPKPKTIPAHFATDGSATLKRLVALSGVGKKPRRPAFGKAFLLSNKVGRIL